MKQILLALLVLLSPALLADDAREATLAKRARGWIDVVKSGDPDAVERFVQENCTPAMLARRTAEERRATVQQIGKLNVVSLRAINDEIVVDAGNVELRFRGESEAPYRIDGMMIRANEGHDDDGPPQAALPPLSIPKKPTREQLRAALDPYLRALEAQDILSGNVLVARGDNVLFEDAYGIAERSFGARNKLSTRFNVGSITKDFTRIAIAQLAQAGKLDVDAPILKYLPDYPNKDVAAKITTAQIARHTSGLGDFFSPRFSRSNMRLYRNPKDFIELCAADPLAFEPGKGQKYSNYGYAVLAAIVERVSGESYFDYVVKHVFQPASMTRSGFFDTEVPEPDVARGYSRDLKVPGDAATLRDNVFALAARGAGFGASKSTARDLFHYTRAMREGKLLNPQWTRWFDGGAPGTSHGERPAAEATAALPAAAAGAVAGGAPGCNAVIATRGDLVVIVLTNLDPPVGEDLGLRIILPAVAAALE